MKKKAVKVGDVLATKNKDLMLVDPRNIVVVDNVRTDYGDIEELSKSIVEIGLQVSLLAKKVRGEDKWELVDGHRRFKAIQLAIKNGHSIPFVEVKPFTGNDEDRMFTMLVTGTGQKQLNEVEQAEAIKRLVAFHYKVEEIAPKIGKSVPHVYNLLSLANVGKQIKNYIADGLISGNTVVQIVKQTKNADEQLKIVTEAIEKVKVETPEGKAPKKATIKHATALKSKSPFQKFNEVILALDTNEKRSAEAERLIEFYMALKTESVETILERFK